MVQLALVLVLRRSRAVRLVLPAALCLLAGACIWVFHSVRVDAIGLHADSVAIQTPVKAHLRDGSTVLYRAGVLLARDTLRGPGVRYALTLRDSTNVTLVPLDSIVAMESYRRGTNAAATAIVSTLATGVTFAATVVVAFLISCASSDGVCSNCPTVYTDSAGSWALQAEGFSYTIGSASETRDVDRIGISPDRDGRIRLEVRNDALETEYLNHLELLEVRHAAGEIALPDPNGAALAVRDLIPATTIADAAGRDLRLLLDRPDGAAFRTDARTLSGVSRADWDDAIYLAAPAAGRDSVALVFRLRNSLLATLLYSEVVLGDRGARSLDWIGRDLDGGGAALARWQEKRLGLRIAIWDGRRYKEIAHIRDSGPHAWNDVAVLIPVLQRDSVRVRLSFPADNWRIDRVAFAMRARRPGFQAHAFSRLRDAGGRDDSSALASIRIADRRYLRTSPGERFSVEVQVGTAGVDVARTFLIATQGYYEPWIGHDGLSAARDSGVVKSLDEELLKALRIWGTVREARERAFATRAASLAEVSGR
jgi:hypothetical protein